MFAGATLPFAPTRRARIRSGDLRPSIEERYSSKSAYLDLIRAASRKLVKQRYLLEEDVEVCQQKAGILWDRFARAGE